VALESQNPSATVCIARRRALARVVAREPQEVESLLAGVRSQIYTVVRSPIYRLRLHAAILRNGSRSVATRIFHNRHVTALKPFE
jgi:hypothetical protein